jgi:hypothetical protein
MLENRKTIQKTRRRGDIEIKQAKRAYTRHVKPERIIVFVLSEPNTHLLPLRSLSYKKIDVSCKVARMLSKIFAIFFTKNKRDGGYVQRGLPP